MKELASQNIHTVCKETELKHLLLCSLKAVMAVDGDEVYITKLLDIVSEMQHSLAKLFDLEEDETFLQVKNEIISKIWNSSFIVDIGTTDKKYLKHLEWLDNYKKSLKSREETGNE